MGTIINALSRDALVKAVNNCASMEEITIRLSPNKVYEINGYTLIFDVARTSKTIIDGNGAILKGDGLGNGICVKTGNVEICNLTFEKYFVGVRIESSEESISNVSIHGCSFRNIESEGVTTSIKNSGRSIENVDVSNNVFWAPPRSKSGHCSTAVNFMTACFSYDSPPIHHVSLMHICCNNNYLKKNPDDGNTFMLGITVHGACNYSFYSEEEGVVDANIDVSDSLEEDITIKDNVIDGVWDIAIDVLAGLPAGKNCQLKNVLISNNIITYYNTAINVGAANIPCNGKVDNCQAKGITIRENDLTPSLPGPNEPQIGIMLFTIRAESGTINCSRCSMEDVFVYNNNIRGREVGIAIEAIHATQDLPYPSILHRCNLERIIIADNRIENAQTAVRIFAAHLEGRYDSFWGHQLKPFDRNLPFSTRCDEAVINYVSVYDNNICNYDTAYSIGAAWACGNALVTECIVGPEYHITRNKLDPGRKVFCYTRHVDNNTMFDNAGGFNNYVMTGCLE